MSMFAAPPCQLHLAFEPEQEWTDGEIMALRELILLEAIETLFDGRTGAATRREIQLWIESDAVRPFSFRLCCEAFGCDPDELHALLQKRRKGARTDRAA